MTKQNPTYNQRLLFQTLVVTAFGVLASWVGLLIMYFKVGDQKTEIINVVQNITNVEKEIANLYDVLKQQDDLRTEEGFRKKDLGVKVEKLIIPNEDNYLLIELSKVPLPKSITVATEERTFPAVSIDNITNIVRIPFNNSMKDILKNDASFISVSYIPDYLSKDKLSILKGYTYSFVNKDQILWEFKTYNNKKID